ncbi:MAG: response regulator transcription factor [Bacteroidales bacterium]|nr:response regulator transcription factor [Bacteroidales bacterium]
MENLSLILVDDHKLFREGLKLLLNNLSFVQEVREASNGQVFLKELEAGVPDLVFIDVDMPVLNGIEATRKALQLFPDLNIIALSMYGDEEYYMKMINAGVKGYILKNCGIQEVEAAIRSVVSGKVYFSQEILMLIIKNINKKREHSKKSGLSEREREILCHICMGLSNHEIADLLCLSKRTVDKHRENLLLKTQSKNTAGLVIYAIKNSIFEI